MGACVSAPPQRAQGLPRKAGPAEDKGAAVQDVLASGQAPQPAPTPPGDWSPSADTHLFPADLQLSQESGSLRIASAGSHCAPCLARQLAVSLGNMGTL